MNGCNKVTWEPLPYCYTKCVHVSLNILLRNLDWFSCLWQNIHKYSIIIIVVVVIFFSSFSAAAAVLHIYLFMRLYRIKMWKLFRGRRVARHSHHGRVEGRTDAIWHRAACDQRCASSSRFNAIAVGLMKRAVQTGYNDAVCVTMTITADETVVSSGVVTRSTSTSSNRTTHYLPPLMYVIGAVSALPRLRSAFVRFRYQWQLIKTRPSRIRCVCVCTAVRAQLIRTDVGVMTTYDGHKVLSYMRSSVWYSAHPQQPSFAALTLPAFHADGAHI